MAGGGRTLVDMPQLCFHDSLMRKQLTAMRIEEQNQKRGGPEDPVEGFGSPIASFSWIIAILQRRLSLERSQTPESPRVHRQNGRGAARWPHREGARQTTPALHPAEDLLDPLALLLNDPMTTVSRRARVQARSVPPIDLRNARADAASAQKTDECYCDNASRISRAGDCGHRRGSRDHAAYRRRPHSRGARVGVRRQRCRRKAFAFASRAV